jgi:hypothetical protein
MSTIFRDAEKEFLTAVNEVRNLLSFMKAASAARSTIGQLLDRANWSSFEQYPKSLAENFIAQKDYNLEVGFSGMVISLASSFEEFVRRLIREGIAELCKKVMSYDKLKARLRQQHLVSSGYALISLFDPPVESNYDYELICQNLGNCHSGSKSLTLNGNVFHTKLSGLTQKTINDGLDRINISIDWNRFGQNAGIRKVLRVDGKRDGTKETIAWLDEFVKKRNKIAHTGIVGYLTKQSEIEEALTFFDAFAPVFADSVEEGLMRSI